MMQKGFGLISILIAVAALAIAGAAWYTLDSWKLGTEGLEDEEFTACTQEAMECPDGSYVSRTGPNCEFAPCSTVGSPTSDSGDTSGWKTYRNEEYGFEFKYPSHIAVGRRASNSELGSVDNPVSGIFVGPLVFVVVNTPELKNLVELNIIERGGESCRAKILNFSSQIVEKLCGAEAGGFWVVRGDNYDVYVDGSSEGYEFPNDIGSFYDVNEMRQLLSTFKFTK